MNVFNIPVPKSAKRNSVDLGYVKVSMVDTSKATTIDELKSLAVMITDPETGKLYQANFRAKLNEEVITSYDPNIVSNNISKAILRLLCAEANAHGAAVNDIDYQAGGRFYHTGSGHLLESTISQITNISISSLMGPDRERGQFSISSRSAGYGRNEGEGMLVKFQGERGISYHLREVNDISVYDIGFTMLGKEMALVIDTGFAGVLSRKATAGLAMTVDQFSINADFMKHLRLCMPFLEASQYSPCLDFNDIPELSKDTAFGGGCLQELENHINNRRVHLTASVTGSVPATYAPNMFDAAAGSFGQSRFDGPYHPGNTMDAMRNGLDRMGNVGMRLVGSKLTSEHGDRGTAVPIMPDTKKMPNKRIVRKDPALVAKATAAAVAEPKVADKPAKTRRFRVAGLSDVSNDRVTSSAKKTPAPGSVMEKILTTAARGVTSKKLKTGK